MKNKPVKKAKFVDPRSYGYVVDHAEGYNECHDDFTTWLQSDECVKLIEDEIYYYSIPPSIVTALAKAISKKLGE